MILAGLKGPVFLVTSNFDVIKTYNNSTAYALSVALLGDAVKGRPPCCSAVADPRPSTERSSGPNTAGKAQDVGL